MTDWQIMPPTEPLAYDCGWSMGYPEPINWETDNTGDITLKSEFAVYLEPDGRVFIGGVEMVELTNERKKAIKMAELLIKLINSCKNACLTLAGDSIYRNYFSDLAQETYELLKSAGWEGE
jgi:hypothetical protein